MRRNNSGFLMITALFTLTGLLALAGVGLTRSLAELSVTNSYVARQQAFHAAEAGLQAMILENRQADWAFLTHQSNGLTGVTARPTPRLAKTRINANGEYELDLGNNQTAWVRSFPDPTIPGRVRISSTATTGTASAQVTAVYEPLSLTDYAFLSTGNSSIGAGQKVTLQGGSGRIFVDGDLRLKTGHYSSDPEFKAVTVEAGDINVNGKIYAKAEHNAPIYIKNMRDADNPVTKWLPKFFDDLDQLGTNRRPSGSKPFDSVRFPTDYKQWLTSTGPFSAQKFGKNFTGFLKEVNTGAVALKDLMPKLPDIDGHVDSFRTQATVTITRATDVPCGAGTLVQFANAGTLEIVNAVEIDVEALGDCTSDTPKVLYGTVPIRLVNGAELDAGLTVASVDAVYIKGDFNTDEPKPAAVVSANWVYHLSDTFKDYTKFIEKNKVYDHAGRLINRNFPTLAEAVMAFSSQNGQPHDGTRPAYDAFKTAYGANSDVRPPYASWLPVDMADSTKQHVAVVTPRRPAPGDSGHNLQPATFEDGGGDGGWEAYDPKRARRGWRGVLERHGSFINLVDNDPATVCLDYPACRATKPQDRVIPGLRASRVQAGHQALLVYEPNLAVTPPPGFQKAESGAATQVFWDQ